MGNDNISILEDNLFIRVFGLLGYDFYSTENKLSNEELLIRQKSSEMLYEVVEFINTLETKFSYEFLRVTRQNFPTSENNEKLRKLKEVKQNILDLSFKINGLTVGRQDRFFRSLLNRKDILSSLKNCDIDLLNKIYEFISVAKIFDIDDFIIKTTEYLCNIEDILSRRKTILESFN